MSGIGNNHANCHANNDLAELVAVCDIAKARADSAAERLGVKAYYSLADMLDGEPNLDIVDVTTGGNENGSWHYEPTMEALENGKHVLVEKPISNDIRQAREMVAKATEENLYLGMVSINSIHLRFENGCVGYLLSQRGDATFGLGGWWSVELAGTRGTFCIENCIEKVTYWPSPGAPDFPLSYWRWNNLHGTQIGWNSHSKRQLRSVSLLLTAGLVAHQAKVGWFRCDIQQLQDSPTTLRFLTEK